ncbi:50S ribosomal protein L30 [archaeon]|nr:50S ribosomal protein L30 [archaeon]
MKLYAVIRVRGSVKAQKRVNDTLEMLGLKYPNNCVFLPDSPGFAGMLKLCKDYITWGEVGQRQLEIALKRWARIGSSKPTDEAWKMVGGAEGLAKKLFEGKTLKEAGLNKTLRLHPPRKGYVSVKRAFTSKGDLNYRGEKINELLERMV